MEIITHIIKNTRVAEVIADGIVIQTAADGAQLLADLYYQEFDLVIIKSTHLNSLFFDLKTGMAGEILQKCSNCRIRLTIVGDFSAFTSKSLRDFIYESNKRKLVNFVESVAEALSKI